jgi:hypothetical protein
VSCPIRCGGGVAGLLTSRSCSTGVLVGISALGQVFREQAQYGGRDVELVHFRYGRGYRKYLPPVRVYRANMTQLVLGIWSSSMEFKHGAARKAFSCANNWEPI